MPYEGEFASYRPLAKLAQDKQVERLLRNARVQHREDLEEEVQPQVPPEPPDRAPSWIIAVDGSRLECERENGYPGARVGYITAASVLIRVGRLRELDESRPVDPRLLRDIEAPAALNGALPGANVVFPEHTSAKHSFRQAVYEFFQHQQVDSEQGETLLDTYEYLLRHRERGKRPRCPYEDDGCDQAIRTRMGVYRCSCSKQKALYSTDALRCHEGFREVGSNIELYNEIMFVSERLLLLTILRGLERQGLLEQYGHRMAFFLDGPLAVFGHPAWLSGAICAELKRLNTRFRHATGHDLVIVGIEKQGAFVGHFDWVDQRKDGGPRFPKRSYFLPTNQYIRSRIICSESQKRYGADTYFGRKFFYKTRGGARIVATIPFLTDEQDTLDTADASAFSSFSYVLALLDELASSRYPNSLMPLIQAHAHAAIPLSLGSKVLDQLARALVQSA